MRLKLFGILICFCVFGCNDKVDDVTSPYNEADALIKSGGKYDTGYYSSLAAELDGTVSSKVSFDVTAMSEQERQDYLIANVTDTSSLQTAAHAQIKLARKQMAKKMLHINLTKGDFQMGEIALATVENTVVLEAAYTVKVEFLVTAKELAEGQITMDDLLNTTHKAKVAADPRNLFGRAGETCASGYTEGQLQETNYFYYFDPFKSECAVAMLEAELTVESLLPTSETYPEYDQLTADGKMELGIIFGAAESTPYDGDWGVMMWRTYATNLRLAGYQEEIRDRGRMYTREKEGIVETIELYSPFDLEAMGTDAVSALLVELLQAKEVIAYNGHSFYGSLDVLQNRENYPENKYQILFMNSCWSYEYYTKQVFENKVTAEDPSGWANADVVNNTQPAYFVNMEVSTRKLVTNLLAGARNGGADNQGRRYSWQNIIGIMNDQVRGVCPEDADPMDCRLYQETDRHEIFGVSGVKTNTYKP